MASCPAVGGRVALPRPRPPRRRRRGAPSRASPSVAPDGASAVARSGPVPASGAVDAAGVRRPDPSVRVRSSDDPPRGGLRPGLVAIACALLGACGSGPAAPSPAASAATAARRAGWRTRTVAARLDGGVARSRRHPWRRLLGRSGGRPRLGPHRRRRASRLRRLGLRRDLRFLRRFLRCPRFARPIGAVLRGLGLGRDRGRHFVLRVGLGLRHPDRGPSCPEFVSHVAPSASAARRHPRCETGGTGCPQDRMPTMGEVLCWTSPARAAGHPARRASCVVAHLIRVLVRRSRPASACPGSRTGRRRSRASSTRRSDHHRPAGACAPMGRSASEDSSRTPREEGGGGERGGNPS